MPTPIRPAALLSLLPTLLLLLARPGTAHADALKPSDWEKTLTAQLVAQEREPVWSTFAAARDRLAAHDVEGALAHLAPLLEQPEHGDLALWLAEAALAEKPETEANGVTLASRRVELLRQLVADWPRSPLQKPVVRRLALRELALFDRLPDAPATPTLVVAERALGRLEVTNELDLLTATTGARYAALCAAEKSERCRVWIEKVRLAAPPKSALAAAIVKVFPKPLPVLDAVPKAAHATKPPTPREPDLDAFDAAFEPWHAGNPKVVVEKLTAFLAKYPNSNQRHRARYWLGRALASQKQAEPSLDAYRQVLRESPLSPYALLSAFELELDPADQFQADTLPTRPADDAIPYLDRARVRRAEALLGLGFLELAAHELRAVTVRPETPNVVLAWGGALSHLAGAHQSAARFIGNLAEREGGDVRQRWVVDAYFPQRWLPAAEENARREKVDPLAILALIRQESANEPEALSTVGAQGLMQLMPTTAATLDGAATRGLLFDPTYNVRLGTKYLAQQLRGVADGRLALALAAYNAGPHRVTKWKGQGLASGDLLSWIERIPFKETREYVTAILRNRHWFARLHGDGLLDARRTLWHPGAAQVEKASD